MSYPIDTGIPPPKPRQRSDVNYAAMPLKTLAIGQSFFVPEADCCGLSIHSVAAVIRTKAQRMGIAVRTEVRRPIGEPHGLRVWRVNPLELWPEGSRHEPRA